MDTEHIETIIYSSRTLGVWRETGKNFRIPLSAEQAYVLGLLAKYGTMEKNFSRWTVPKDIVDMMEYLSLTRRTSIKKRLMNRFLWSPAMDKETREDYRRLLRYQRELVSIWGKKSVKFDYRKYRVSIRNGRRERGGVQHVHLTLTSKRMRFSIDVLSSLDMWLYTHLRESPMRYLNYCVGNTGIDEAVITNLVTGRRTVLVSQEGLVPSFTRILTQRAHNTLRRCLLNDVSPEESALITN